MFSASTLDSQVDSTSQRTAERLLNEARLLESSHQFSAAELILRAAEDCCPNALIKLERAEFLVRRERWNDARSAYRALWNQAALENDSHLLSVVLHNLAGVERRLGNWSAARSHQFRAMLPHDATSEADTAAELTGRGLDAMAEGDYSLAENLFLRSLLLERQAGSRAGEAADCGNLGVLASLRGDLAVGIRFLGRAYTIHRDLIDYQNCGSDLTNLSELFIKSGRLSLAEKCLRRAIGHFDQAGAPLSKATAEARLKDVARVIGMLHRDPEWN